MPALVDRHTMDNGLLAKSFQSITLNEASFCEWKECFTLTRVLNRARKYLVHD